MQGWKLKRILTVHVQHVNCIIATKRVWGTPHMNWKTSRTDKISHHKRRSRGATIPVNIKPINFKDLTSELWLHDNTKYYNACTRIYNDRLSPKYTIRVVWMYMREFCQITNNRLPLLSKSYIAKSHLSICLSFLCIYYCCLLLLSLIFKQNSRLLEQRYTQVCWTRRQKNRFWDTGTTKYCTNTDKGC